MRRSLWSIGLILTIALSAGAAEAPAHLPRYDLHVDLDTHAHTATVRETVTWTNPADRPTRQLVLNFYPRYSVPRADRLRLMKTVEMFRLSPSEAMISAPAGEVTAVRLASSTAVKYAPAPDNPTAVVIELDREVPKGGTVTAEVECVVRLPNKQGRWGHWEGVHTLVNALPTAAFYDTDGWHPTPFVPWHQPFWNEAGVYTATVVVPAEQKVACGAAVKSESTADGRRTLAYHPHVGRDFALTCSADYREYTATTRTPDGRQIALKCLAFERHQFYAEKMLGIVAEAIPVFAGWFGPFPHDQFTIAESYFGWNGNESAGLVMIDERVFAMPHGAVGYVEYLVSHETCHQWWYNLVGTNGYAETFVDEGAATHFTHKLLDRTRGRNNALVKWTGDYGIAPSILRDNYRNSTVYGAIGRDQMTPAAGPLPEFGHLGNLFTAAYDRGSKVFGLIEQRMTPESAEEFFRGLVAKYSWRVLSARQLQAELEASTGKKFGDLFDEWVYGRGLTDWAVTGVTVDDPKTRPGPVAAEQRTKGGYRVQVTLTQSRELWEPTSVGFKFADDGGYTLRVPVGGLNDGVELPEYDGRVVRTGPKEVMVSLTLPVPPTDVRVDPDGVLLDANPANNGWSRAPRVAVLPFYSMVNDADLTNDFDRWNVKAGLWASGSMYTDPWFTRGTTYGVRVGATRTQVFQGGVYSGYRQDYNDLVLGADGLFDHVPFPNTQLGFNYEYRLAQFFENGGANTANRAVLYGRYVMQPGSSLYLPPISYADLFTTYQDNFLPIARERGPNAERPNWSWLAGVHYRLNLYTPYWDPETGGWVDLSYAGGVANLGNTVGANQVRAELAGVRKLPEGLGYLSEVKLAGRVIAGQAWPDRGEFFALGGGTQFRGFDIRQRQGSGLWVANAEVRMPLLRHPNWECLDRVIGVKAVHVAAFYDAGAVYTDGQVVGNVAHALGVGLRVDLSFFSFMERAVLRFDAAKTVNADTPVQFWFGVQHPF